jgi:hypothetical protein
MGSTVDEFEQWVDKERRRVEAYLETQGIAAPRVGPWPAFDVAPCFAIWAVESKRQAGKIGWWAFSGDCPTDYVTEDGKCHPRNALELLLKQWNSYLPELKIGKQPSQATLGSGSNLQELGQLLEKRVVLLREWLADDSLWEDR